MPKFPLFLVFVSLWLLCCPAIAAEISAGTVALGGTGQTATVPITLDQASDGLAGYTLDISVADPSVAEIVAVTYPGWASLSQSTGLPAGEVRLKAVDINREVQAGATNIPLATVTVKSQAAGSTTLQVTPVRLSDDSGSSIASAPVQSALTVAGPASSSGSSSGSSGSSSGSSSSTGSTTGSTTTGAGSGSSTASGSSGAVGTGGSSRGTLAVQPVHTPDSWATGSPEPGQPSAKAPESGARAPPVSAPQTTTLDWIKANLVPVGIGLVAAAAILLFIGARVSSRSGHR